MTGVRPWQAPRPPDSTTSTPELRGGGAGIHGVLIPQFLKSLPRQAKSVAVSFAISVEHRAQEVRQTYAR